MPYRSWTGQIEALEAKNRELEKKLKNGCSGSCLFKVSEQRYYLTFVYLLGIALLVTFTLLSWFSR